MSDMVFLTGVSLSLSVTAAIATGVSLFVSAGVGAAGMEYMYEVVGDTCSWVYSERNTRVVKTKAARRVPRVRYVNSCHSAEGYARQYYV